MNCLQCKCAFISDKWSWFHLRAFQYTMTQWDIVPAHDGTSEWDRQSLPCTHYCRGCFWLLWRCAESGETLGAGPSGSQPVWRGRLVGWLITTLLIPNKLMAVGEHHLLLLAKARESSHTHREACSTSLKKKKPTIENVGPVMANVRYRNTICMQLYLHVEQRLKHKGHFLK